jgi:hypothetical protein
MSTLTPLATKLASQIVTALVTFISNIWKWLSNKFGKKVNKIIIKLTSTLSKSGWRTEPGDLNNGLLIESVFRISVLQ